MKKFLLVAALCIALSACVTFGGVNNVDVAAASAVCKLKATSAEVAKVNIDILGSKSVLCTNGTEYSLPKEL